MKQCKSWPLMPFCTCLCSIFLNTTKTLPHANFQWEAAAFCSLLYQSEEALSFKNVQHHRLKYYLDNIVRNFSWMTWQNTSIRSRLIRTSHTVKQKRSDAKHENCANRFPFFCILSHPIFSSVDRWLRKTGSLPSQTATQDVREVHERQKWKSEFWQDLKQLLLQAFERWLTKSAFLSQ